MKYVYVVIDSQSKIVGVYTSQARAQAAADAHCYFCRISCEPVIK